MTSSSAPRRILIIGGGVAGLTLALALKRVGRSTGLNLEPVIFEQCWAHTAFTEHPATDVDYAPHYVLWRWAVEMLLELGLGGRLSKIAAPILNFTSLDMETKEPVVEWPPKQSDSTTVDAEIGADSALPPMVAIRRADLIRLLLLGLSGARDDLVFGDDFLPAPANNSDLVADPVHGILADLAVGEWFYNEGFDELVPELILGERLESYAVHPVTGEVTATFESGRVERGAVLVGADGSSSKVRELLYKKRHTTSHAGAAIFSGITRLVVPPVDTPDLLENGTPIPDLLREDVHELCPDGRSVSIVGRGLAFGISNLGNGILGWNLVVAQAEPGQHTNTFNMAKTRKLVSEAIAKNPRSSIVMSRSNSTGSGLPNLASIDTDTTNPEDKWNGNSLSRQSASARGSQQRLVDLFAEPEETVDDANTDDEFSARTDEPSTNDALRLDVAAGKRPFSDSTPMVSTSAPSSSWNAGEGSSAGDDDAGMSPAAARRLRRGRTTSPSVISPDMQRKLREKLDANRRSLQATTPPPAVPNLFAPPEPLNGSELRTLALRLSQGADLPHPCHAIMARTEPALTRVQDVQDMSDDPPESYTYPYHPGRVILIGDAAHLIAPNAHGSLGGGLALTDAAMLAKLLAKNLAMADMSSDGTDKDDNAYRQTAVDFDRERAAMCAAIMREARAEGGWGRTENTWMRSLMRIGRKYTPTSWTRSTYAQNLTRGAVKSGLPSLMPVGGTY